MKTTNILVILLVLLVNSLHSQSFQSNYMGQKHLGPCNQVPSCKIAPIKLPFLKDRFSGIYKSYGNFGLGITHPGIGILATKFLMNGSGQINGANIEIADIDANVGNKFYAVVLDSSGLIITKSDCLMIDTCDLGTIKTFVFQQPPIITDEIYYIGLAQTIGHGQWFPICISNEKSGIRDTGYAFSISGGAPSSLLFEGGNIGIEPLVGSAILLSHDVGVLNLNAVQVFSIGTISPDVTVKNYGTSIETFNVTMTIGSYSSTKEVVSLPPDATLQITFDPWTNSAGDYTMNVCTQLTGDLNTANNCKNQAIKVLGLSKIVCGYIAFNGSGTDPVGPTSFNLASPGSLTSIANQSTLPYLTGGAWANGQWFATVYGASPPYSLIKVNPLTGVRTVIGNMGLKMNGLSYNTNNGTLYGVNETSLYTIDTVTGASTLVGSNSGIYMISLAINHTGQGYAVDIINDVLGSVNLTNGAFTPIGPIGFNANFDQDMEFDRETGNLFMTTFGLQGDLRYVDINSGNAMLIGSFEGGAEVTGFAIPYTLNFPTVNTAEISNITDLTAASGGEITNNGGAPVSARGVCWSTLPNPTIANSHTSNGTGTGSFSSSITGLAPCSTYYVRAYATNLKGTSYSSIQRTFNTICVSTASASNVTNTSASSGGNITSDGNSPVSNRGVCISTSHNPTIADQHSNDGTGTGVFTSSLVGLVENTMYYIRAFCTNANGTFYGSEKNLNTLSAPCLPNVTFSGKTYLTVQIGDQCWLKENLNIGTKINSSLDQTNNGTIEKYCMNNLESNCDIYGGLYQWAEMVQYLNQASNTTSWNPVPTGNIQGICPSGWHLPSDTECSTLTTLQGGESVAGGKMKEAGYLHWTAPNTGATNISGFTALPGGLRHFDGTLYDLTYSSYFWSSSQIDAVNGWSRILFFYTANTERYNGKKSNGFSVRCIKDLLPPLANQSVQNVTVLNSQQSCYNALQTITIAGSGSTFIVQNGGSATLIAGQNIRFLPGTLVNAGGYMHGYVSTNGLFCNTIPTSKSAIETQEEGIVKNDQPELLKIYPNPTSGSFILEISGSRSTENIRIDIYGLRGDKIISEIFIAEKKHEFSLSGFPAGIYFIRAISGTKVETGLIVKQ